MAFKQTRTRITHPNRDECRHFQMVARFNFFRQRRNARQSLATMGEYYGSYLKLSEIKRACPFDEPGKRVARMTTWVGGKLMKGAMTKKQAWW